MDILSMGNWENGLGIFIFFISLLSAGIIAIFLYKKNIVLKSDYTVLKGSKAFIERRILDLEKALDETRKMEQAYLTLLREIEKDKSALDRDKIHSQQEHLDLMRKLQKEISTVNELNNTIQSLKVDKGTLTREIELLKEQQQNSDQIFLSAKAEFETIANKILEKEGRSFQDQAAKDIGVVIKPIKEELASLKEKIKDQQKVESELKGTITQMESGLNYSMSQMSQQYKDLGKITEDFTNAIKGNVKLQGNWGESQVERIFEITGFQKGIHYFPQGIGLVLSIPEEDKRPCPDFIIKLTHNKHLIVDSKVSLNHYVSYFNSEKEDEKLDFLDNFKQSVKAHIISLGNARYHEISQLRCPDFVFMFMPIEAAFVLAMKHFPDIHDFALKHKVALTCPSTLISSLKTVAYLRRLELQHKNFEEIARLAGSIHDKIIDYVLDVERIKEKLKESLGEYEKSSNTLYKGRGNVIRTIKRIEELGVKTKKQLSTIKDKHEIEFDDGPEFDDEIETFQVEVSDNAEY